MQKDGQGRQYLSISQILTYLRCPEHYFFRYVLGKKIPPRSAQTLGRSVHEGLAHNYRQKKDSQKDLLVKEVLDFYDSVFETFKDETEWAKNERPGKVKDQGVGLIKVYHKQMAPKIQPLEVEEWFEVEFDNADYQFKGIMDLVDIEHRIIDHKTSSKTPNANEIATDLQMTAYALGHRVKFGIPEKELRLDYMVKTKTPKVVSLETKRTQEDIDRFLRVVAYVAKAIKEKIFYCAHPTDSWVCSKNWCGYYELHHELQKEGFERLIQKYNEKEYYQV